MVDLLASFLFSGGAVDHARPADGRSRGGAMAGLYIPRPRRPAAAGGGGGGDTDDVSPPYGWSGAHVAAPGWGGARPRGASVVAPDPGRAAASSSQVLVAVVVRSQPRAGGTRGGAGQWRLAACAGLTRAGAPRVPGYCVPGLACSLHGSVIRLGSLPSSLPAKGSDRDPHPHMHALAAAVGHRPASPRG